MSAKDKIHELMGTVREIKKKAGETLAEFHKEIFEAHPDLIAIKWHQYTPGFNDGDPCYFTVGDVKLAVKDSLVTEENEDDFEYGSAEFEGENYGFVEYFDDKTDKSKAWNELGGNIEELHQLLSDVLEEKFDSDKEITIHRNGKVEIDYYDCGY